MCPRVGVFASPCPEPCFDELLINLQGRRFPNEEGMYRGRPAPSSKRAEISGTVAEEEEEEEAKEEKMKEKRNREE